MKLIGSKTEWTNFGATQPGIFPAGTDGSTRDLIVYENVAAMIDPDGRSVGATFLRNNLSKRSVAIDLKSAEGREIFADLAGRFDVVAENFKPGTMDRMGLGYEALSARYPSLVFVSISGFGNTVETPYREWPAYAAIVVML